MDQALFGREPELAAGRAFLDGGAARALVVEGQAGIGKTAVWHALVGIARRDGYLVLQSVSEQAEARLTFAGLADLFGTVADEALPSLPAPLARALEVALLRVEAGASPSDPRAVATGVLGLLRALAARQAVLVAIDDVQWLDKASMEAISFAARRLGEENVRFLLTRRQRAPTQLERALAAELGRLDVGPLSFDATRRMLADRLRLALPRRLLQQVFDCALGNPLFAIEVGRMLVEQGLPAMGDDLPLPETAEDLLGARVTGLPRAVRRLLLVVALSGDLKAWQLPGVAEPGTLDDAIERGLIVADGSTIRAAHPLLAAAVKKRSSARERRELHLLLASVAADDDLRAHHLALASRDPDEQLAVAVASAAGRAFARGARREAAELGEHAIRLTPQTSPARPERLLALATHLQTAGEIDRLRDLLTANLGSIPRGSQRARAWLLLAEAIYEHLDDYRRHLETARMEAESDPGLHALVVAKLSSALISVERIADAEERAVEVLPAAVHAGPDVERAVLFSLGWARALSGRRIDDICQRWNAASAAPGHLAESPERIAGQRHVWRGEIAAARPVFDRLLALSDERGEIDSHLWARLHLCELALRIGDWATARRLLDEWAETAERELFVEPLDQRCHALLAAGQGFAEEAASLSDATIARAKAIGFQWDWLEGLRARGTVALLTGQPGRAAESLGEVWAHTEREGVDEPGVFPVAPDLVEALVELGETTRALTVTARLRALSEQQDHPWGLVTAKRCGALVRLATPPSDGDPAAELEAAACAYGELGLSFDQARTLLALGMAERKLRRWASARRSLERAGEIFADLGSTGWAERARAEADRISARRPGRAGELTPTERRVVELAAGGRSNKEIAQALFITISTVEGHLSRAYLKLGVRSRTQLAQYLTSRQGR